MKVVAYKVDSKYSGASDLDSDIQSSARVLFLSFVHAYELVLWFAIGVTVYILSLYIQKETLYDLDAAFVH